VAARRPGRILVTVAVAFEARGLRRRLHRRPPGRGAELLIRTIGLRAAELSRLEPDFLALRPDLVLVAGLAGGCAPESRPGDVIVGCPVATGSAEAWMAPDPRLVARARVALDEASVPYRIGALLTVEAVAGTPSAKAWLWRTHGALAVDLESARVLAWARARGLPALAVRAVADGPGEDLPPALAEAVTPAGRVSPRALLSGAVRPGLVLAAWRLRRRSALALDHLARFLRALPSCET
jgi:hypothetical protein